jgi:hypothetical protein
MCRKDYFVFILFLLLGLSCHVFPQNDIKCDSSMCARTLYRSMMLNTAFLGMAYVPYPYAHYNALFRTEAFDEDTMDYVLPVCIECIAKSKDTALAILYFKFLINHGNSADEEPSTQLGDLYYRNADFTLAILSKFGEEDKKVLVGDLSFGWENVSYGGTIPQAIFDSLDKRIKPLTDKYFPDDSTTKK